MLTFFKKNHYCYFAILTFHLILSSINLSAKTIDLNIKNINSNGEICIAIFESADRFYRYRNHQNCLVKDQKIKYIFEKVKAGQDLNKRIDLKSGIYAIRVFLDKNFNKKIDKNFFGIKKERIGYSNNPKIIFGEPYFSEIEFGLSGHKNLEIIL
jgi:uncharacterized protein (DUF2141 family)